MLAKSRYDKPWLVWPAIITIVVFVFLYSIRPFESKTDVVATGGLSKILPPLLRSEAENMAFARADIREFARTVTSTILISPDGAWLLQERSTTTEPGGCIAIDHTLWLKGLKGQGDKTILQAHEASNVRGDGCVQSSDRRLWPSTWYPAGFSADGSRVYFTRRNLAPLADPEPITTDLGSELDSAVTRTGYRMKLFGNVDDGGTLTIMGLETRHDRLLYQFVSGGADTAEGKPTITYLLTNFKGADVKEITLPVAAEHGGFASLVRFSPGGSRVAIMWHKPSWTAGSVDYSLGVYDLSSRNWKDVRVPTTRAWLLGGWSNDNTVALWTKDWSKAKASVETLDRYVGTTDLVGWIEGAKTIGTQIGQPPSTLVIGTYTVLTGDEAKKSALKDGVCATLKECAPSGTYLRATGKPPTAYPVSPDARITRFVRHESGGIATDADGKLKLQEDELIAPILLSGSTQLSGLTQDMVFDIQLLNGVIVDITERSKP